MKIASKALLTHMLTATGAVFAMLALLAAAQEDWSVMFLWLVVAFFVDGIDGPLARKYDVKTNAPRFDGEPVSSGPLARPVRHAPSSLRAG